MSKPEWSAVASILIAAMKVGYYSLALSPAFAVAALFGEHKLTDKLLLNSFTNYVSIEEKENIQEMLSNFEEDNAQLLLELLSFYNCCRRTTEDNLHAFIIELVHQEIVQKPRYIANCFMEVMCANPREKLLAQWNIWNSFTKDMHQLPKKVINALVCNPANDAERMLFTHLTRYIKSLSKDNLLAFLYASWHQVTWHQMP